MDDEPLLRAEDLAAWTSWAATARLHARSPGYRRRVEQARSAMEALYRRHPDALLMWSAGKDSTAMVHLASTVRPGCDACSEKDDLDFPGERAYVERWAHQWGVALTIVTPEMSPAEWVAEHAGELGPSTDIHARTAELSRRCFYEVVERAAEDRSAIVLGLRAEESRGRALNRYSRGLEYRKASGQVVAQPIADWTGLDVMAYLVTNEIDPLPVYRCVALMHRLEPWRIRKSWWLPGASARHGYTAWLRHYYPSLYHRIVELVPRQQGCT